MSGCATQESTSDKESAYTHYTVTITTITEKGGRVDWSHALNVIAFDKRGEDGFYDVYIMDPDGTNEYCLTCDIELDHHMGNPAWHPSGEWIVFQAVNTALIPSSMDAEEVNAHTNPGAGWLNNVWVTDKKGHFYPLTDVGNKGGVLHPHFSHDGSRLLWAEKTNNGTWVLTIADFVINDTPHLENIQSFTPGEQQFYESHGFSPDNTKILFSGNLQKDQPLWGLDIYELTIKTQKLIPLTSTFYQWDEHAHYSPDGQKIVWMSSAGYDMNPLKTDFWIMDCTGSHKQQLTFFNTPGHPHYRGVPIVAADSSWGPDGQTIIAYIKTESKGLGSDGSIILIELNQSPDVLTSFY
jgi:Tol biopolymer transport system component